MCNKFREEYYAYAADIGDQDPARSLLLLWGSKIEEEMRTGSLIAPGELAVIFKRLAIGNLRQENFLNGPEDLEDILDRHKWVRAILQTCHEHARQDRYTQFHRGDPAKNTDAFTEVTVSPTSLDSASSFVESLYNKAARIFRNTLREEVGLYINAPLSSRVQPSKEENQRYICFVEQAGKRVEEEIRRIGVLNGEGWYHDIIRDLEIRDEEGEAILPLGEDRASVLYMIIRVMDITREEIKKSVNANGSDNVRPFPIPPEYSAA